jgi:hypothetical protein
MFTPIVGERLARVEVADVVELGVLADEQSRRLQRARADHLVQPADEWDLQLGH